MKIPFRQGILRYQRDSVGTATFLQKSNGGSSIDLVVSPDPTIVTIAHRSSNYLIEEGKTTASAWSGFVSGQDYWLFLEIDLLTGQRNFGSTKLAPTYGMAAPANPATDQHWYDTTLSTMCMKVFNGTIWVEKLRVFVAKYKGGAIIEPYAYGSQVNILTSSDCGFVLFDNEGKPLKRFYRRDAGEFFTTSSIFTTHTAKAVNISLDAINSTVAASEPIPAFSLVSRSPEDGYIQLATYTNASRVAVGIVQEDFYDGEIGIYTQAGYVTNEQWNWTKAPGSLIFLGANGVVVDEPTQLTSIQIVGEIVSPRTIKLDIKAPIFFDDSSNTDYQNLVNVMLDKVTGKFIATKSEGGGGGEPGESTKGYRHVVGVPADEWTIAHNRDSANVVVQVQDTDGNVIYPDEITVQDLNTIVVTFASPQDGVANVVFFEL